MTLIGTSCIAVQDLGLQWIMDKGHIATEEAYPYLGNDDYCNAEGKDHISFSVSVVSFGLVQTQQ